MRFLAISFCALLIASMAGAQSPTTLIPAPKTAYLYSEFSPFVITQQTVVVVPDNAHPDIIRAADFLQREIKRRIGIMPAKVSLSWYVLSVPPSLPKSFIFLPSDNEYAPLFKKRILNRIEEIPSKDGGYIADFRSEETVFFFHEGDGAMNAVSTALQLLNNNSKGIAACHIWDAPDYPIRWVFSMHNLLVNQNISNLSAITDTMVKYKLNGLQQNDYKYNILDRMTARYFENVDTLKRRCQERNIQIIPGVCGIGWSDGILQHNPNLAEGVEARTEYVVEADTGRLIANASVALPGGNFENVDSQGKFTGWGFYDDSFSQDKTVYRSGKASAHADNIRAANSSGNARLSRTMSCKPHGYYTMSAWLKTNNIQGGFFQLLAIGKNAAGAQQSLTFTSLDIPSTTTDWQKVEVSFNTLESTSLTLYCGAWGVNTGEFWIDDFAIQSAGLTNILRRQGTPLHITNTKTGAEYFENMDIAPLIDPYVEKNNAAFGPYHSPPTLHRLPSGSLRNGDTVVVSYFHPFTAVSNNQGNGSVMVCVSEDTLYSILGDQATRVNNIYNPESFFLGHDEIRNMNRDSSCLRRKSSAADLLADNVSKCDSIVNSAAPNSRRFIWSDMFDSLHNAGNNYYLVNGDLSGVWTKIPHSLNIVNWNNGKRRPSLEFFAEQGFRQISAPYYDGGNTSSIRAWRLAQENVPNIDGMMYTTWQQDYSQMRTFSYYAWGAGPYIMHRPIDSNIFDKSTVAVEAHIAADPFDNTDNIASASLVIHRSNISQAEQKIPMNRGGAAGTWTADLIPLTFNWFRYSIEAENKQGIVRRTPEYEVLRKGTVGLHEVSSSIINPKVIPNPVRDAANLQFTVSVPGSWAVEVTDVLGRRLASYSGYADHAQEIALLLKMDEFPSGAYRAAISMKENFESVMLLKR